MASAPRAPAHGPGHLRYLIGPELVGQRLDQALAACSGLSRRQVRTLIDGGKLWLNQNPTRVQSRVVQVGDVVDLLDAKPTTPPAHAPRPLPILYEDGHLLAIDKPAGVVTQPPRQRTPGEITVHEWLALQLAWREGRRSDLLLFHRLDRMTTGVLVFARQHEAARALARAWAGGKVRKTYLTVVVGDPGAKPVTVDAPIASDPLVPGRYRPSRRGKPARTEVRRLSVAGELALCEVRPFTGRTHQVRVHLAHLGHPVAGDSLYGGRSDLVRPFLHAWRLVLPHPRERRNLTIEAPIPEEMARFLAAHALFGPGA